MVEYFVGLDLGQAADYTALAIAEQVDAPTGATRAEVVRDALVVSASGRASPVVRDAPVTERQYHVRELRRFPLGTGYPDIVADVCCLLRREPLRSAQVTLALDETGVGAPVRDLFARALPQVGLLPVEGPTALLVPITITGGHTPVRDGRGWHTPKRDLVSVAQVLLQRRRLKVAPGLPEAATLVRELETFRVKISDRGHDSYRAWRETDHDDLVLAVALAVWVAEHGQPRRLRML